MARRRSVQLCDAAYPEARARRPGDRRPRHARHSCSSCSRWACSSGSRSSPASLERGTVRLAWWLTPSRWRWYLARLLPILGVVVVLTFAAGVAADRGCSPRTIRPLTSRTRSMAMERGADCLRLGRCVRLRGRGRRRVVHRADVARRDASRRSWPPSACPAASTSMNGSWAGEAVVVQVDQADLDNGGFPCRRQVHRSEVRAAGRHPRRLRVLQRQRPGGTRSTRTATWKFPMVNLVIPGDALSLRRSARGRAS